MARLIAIAAFLLVVVDYCHQQDTNIVVDAFFTQQAIISSSSSSSSSSSRRSQQHSYNPLQSSESDESFYNEEDSSIKRDTLLRNGQQQQPRPVGAVLRNEFSRIIKTDQIFHASRKRQSQQNQQRDYDCTIVAKPQECQALADRFDLTNLKQLEATLQIRPANFMFGGGSSATSVVPVEVEGTILSHLTQTCVRTNERFEVEVEIPVYALVKPMSGGNAYDDFDVMPEEDYDSTKKNNKSSKKPKRNKAKLNQSTKNVHSLADVFDLQAAIEANERAYDEQGGGFDDDMEASLVEDESIYCTDNGVLDVGELVAQTFWLQLDPFPKKPGTGPVEYEITG
jgi:hypothetical protein